MEVAERDVGAGDGKHVCRHVVVEDALRLPLTAAEKLDRRALKDAVEGA